MANATLRYQQALSGLALKIVVMARQEARVKKGWGDFTFLYTDGFYCVHLLIPKSEITDYDIWGAECRLSTTYSNSGNQTIMNCHKW
jgi:hypothetical protein